MKRAPLRAVPASARAAPLSGVRTIGFRRDGSRLTSAR
jgi:hypothetical protein